MFPQLPSNLDMLASAGIIDFDAQSYIQGTPARYWGAPQTYLPLETPLPQMPYKGNTGYNGIPGQPPLVGPAAVLPSQPAQDIFGHPSVKSKTATWKKVLAGVSTAVLVGLAAFKLKGIKIKDIPAKIKNYDYAKKFTSVKDSVVKFVQDKYNWAKAKFGGAPKPTPPPKPPSP